MLCLLYVFIRTGKAKLFPRVHVIKITIYREIYSRVPSQDDVIKWKHFPCYWPFVRGIHRSMVNSPHNGPVTRSFGVFFDLPLNERLSKQSWGWWFETASCPSWRHCNGCQCGNRLVSQMRATLAACREPAGKLWQLCKVLYVFEHKTQYLLIHAPFTRLVLCISTHR